MSKLGRADDDHEEMRPAAYGAKLGGSITCRNISEAALNTHKRMQERSMPQCKRGHLEIVQLIGRELGKSNNRSHHLGISGYAKWKCCQ